MLRNSHGLNRQTVGTRQIEVQWAVHTEQDTRHQEIDQRLTDLEIKASFTEHLLEQLDSVIVRQQQQIDLLLREITELRQPAVDGAAGMGGSARNLRDDLPPHF